MITLTCDNCERPIPLPDEVPAGGKVKCPACGDINIIPARAAQPQPRQSAERDPSGLPAPGEPEERILLVRQAMARARPVTFLILAILLLAGIGGAIYFGSIRWHTVGFWSGVGAALLSLVLLAGWKLSTLDQSIEVTNKRTIERKGLFSRATSEVRHQDVRNIQINQSFLQRILNVGSVGISSSGQDELEIRAEGIPNPRRIRDTVDRYRPL